MILYRLKALSALNAISGHRATKVDTEAYAQGQAYEQDRVLELAIRANLDSVVGDNCNMPECEGYLESNAGDHPCTCHCGNPPCGSCTSGMHCSDCDWEVPDA